MRTAQYFSRDGRPLSAAEALDRNGAIRDGVIARVRMTDSARQRFTDARSYWDANKDALRVTDMWALGGGEGCRPGFRVLDAPLNQQAMRDARAAYVRDLESAYLNPTGFGERGVIGQQAGDQCTINGAPGHLRMVNGALQCVADDDDDDDEDNARTASDGLTADALQVRREQIVRPIYDSYVAEIANTWKVGKA
jgi:hypothetical protein